MRKVQKFSNKKIIGISERYPNVAKIARYPTSYSSPAL